MYLHTVAPTFSNIVGILKFPVEVLIIPLIDYFKTKTVCVP